MKNARIEEQKDAAPPPSTGPRRQVGALCWRRHGKGIEVLLITSRETGRWVIPKGGLIAGIDAPGSARQEAWEEAGVEGALSLSEPLGCFDYDKLNRRLDQAEPCRVDVYPIRVDRVVHDFPEREERRRKWFSPAKAAARVAEPALRQLLQDLAEDPSRLVPTATEAESAPEPPAP